MARIKFAGVAPAMLFVALSAPSACSAPAAAPDAAAQVAEAQRAFVGFDLLRSRDLFAAALAADPTSAEAAYGHARTLMVLNQYDEALPAFERALELAPDDPRVREGLLWTLVWGGKLRGRRAWLDRALESGGETIRVFPDRVEAYDLVEDAAGELNQPDTWLQMLAALEPELGSAPVFRVHAIGARLAQARSTGDAAGVAELEGALRGQLTAAAAEEEARQPGDPTDAGRRYLLALGYKLLGDDEQEEAWLQRLDETPEGRRMGGSMTHFDLHYRDFFAVREAPVAEQLAVIERWKERFRPAWETDDITTYRVPLAMELSVLSAEAGRQRQEGGTPGDEVLDRIVAIGRDLARLDTWGGAGVYAQVAGTLVDLDVRPEQALGLADEGIAGLRAGNAGLIYPGAAEDQLPRSRDLSVAALERIRGVALEALDRTEEAEAAYRNAVAISPRSDRLAALGRLLERLGRDAEAYETLVAALAHDADDERIGDHAEELRGLALAAAGRAGRDAGAFGADLEIARLEVADEARRRLVDDRLDREVTDFELTDTAGREWRLSDLRGSVVVLNYWATWCGPCRAEMPHYQDLVDAYGGVDDVVFLAISTDTDHSLTRAFLEESGYGFTTLFDEGSATDFHVTGIPAHFVIGPRGRLQYAASGFSDAERYGREMRWRIEALRRR